MAHEPDALQDDARDVRAARAWTSELLAETALATIRDLTREVRRLVDRTTDLTSTLPLPDAARTLRAWYDDIVAAPDLQRRIGELEATLAAERAGRDGVVHRADMRATAAEQLATEAEERCATVLHEAELARRAGIETRDAYARLENETATLRGWLADSQDRVAMLEAELRATTEAAGLERQVAEKAQAERDAQWREQRAALELTARHAEERRGLLEGELARCRAELERCRTELETRAEAITRTADQDVADADRAATVELDRLRTSLADVRAELQATRSELTLATGRIATLTRVHDDVVAERTALLGDLAKTAARERELERRLAERPTASDLAVETHDASAFPPLAIEETAASGAVPSAPADAHEDHGSDDAADALDDAPDGAADALDDAPAVEVVGTDDVQAIADDDESDAPVERIAAPAPDDVDETPADEPTATDEPVAAAIDEAPSAPVAFDAADSTTDDAPADHAVEAGAGDGAETTGVEVDASDVVEATAAGTDATDVPDVETWATYAADDAAEQAHAESESPAPAIEPTAWSPAYASGDASAASPYGSSEPVETDDAVADASSPAWGSNGAGAASRVIAVLDGAAQWDVTPPNAVLPLDAEAAVVRVRELDPACCLVNIASPAALTTARALRADGLQTPFWGCIAGTDADGGVAIGPIDVLARPIAADRVHAQLGDSLPAGTKVVAVGSDSATLIPLRQGLLASGASVRVAWNCAQANDLVASTRPNVLVVDLAQPPADTAGFVATLLTAQPARLVLVLPTDGTTLPEFCRAITAALDPGAGEARAALLARAGA